MRTPDIDALPVVVLSGVRVSMRDGVELNLRITRPAVDGRYPAVMEYNPYRRLGPSTEDDPGYPPVVRYLATRIAVMHRGKLIEVGDTEQITNRPADPYTRSLMAATPQLFV